MREPINLGDEVKDPITGFQGIAVVRHQYLYGCDRIGVQSPKKKDGTLDVVETFDEPQLNIVKRHKIKVKPTEIPGGPAKYPDSRKY